MKSIFYSFAILALIVFTGCKDEAPKTKKPSRSVVKKKVTVVKNKPAPAPKTEKSLSDLQREAMKIRTALLDRDPSFNVKNAVKVLSELKAMPDEEAKNTVAELTLVIKNCYDDLKKSRTGRNSLMPQEFIEEMVRILPLLEICLPHEYRMAQYDMKSAVEVVVRQMEQHLSSGIPNQSRYFSLQETILSTLGLYDKKLQPIMEDFWTAEEKGDFAVCTAAIKKIEPFCRDEIANSLKNLMRIRLIYWKEHYRNVFSNSSDLQVKKDTLAKLKLLYEPDSRELAYFNKEYREKLREQAFSGRPDHRNQPRPRTREEFIQRRNASELTRAIVGGNPVFVRQVLDRGADAKKLRIRGQSPYSFLLDNIERGRRKDQYMAVIAVLLERKIEPTKEEAARIKAVMPQVKLP